MDTPDAPVVVASESPAKSKKLHKRRVSSKDINFLLRQTSEPDSMEGTLAATPDSDKSVSSIAEEDISSLQPEETNSCERSPKSDKRKSSKRKSTKRISRQSIKLIEKACVLVLTEP